MFACYNPIEGTTWYIVLAVPEYSTLKTVYDIAKIQFILLICAITTGISISILTMLLNHIKMQVQM